MLSLLFQLFLHGLLTNRENSHDYREVVTVSELDFNAKDYTQGILIRIVHFDMLQ